MVFPPCSQPGRTPPMVADAYNPLPTAAALQTSEFHPVIKLGGNRIRISRRGRVDQLVLAGGVCLFGGIAVSGIWPVWTTADLEDRPIVAVVHMRRMLRFPRYGLVATRNSPSASRLCAQRIASPILWAATRLCTLNTPDSTAVGMTFCVPNAASHAVAFAAASLLSLFTLLVDEFDTLHSIGMVRPSQTRTTRSALRPLNVLSRQNSPRLGSLLMLSMLRVGTCVNP